jgi:hypothetical protein
VLADHRLQHHHLELMVSSGGELMRGVLLSLVCAAGLLAATPATSSASLAPAPASVSAPASAPVFALQQPDKTIEINIGERGGGRWYRSPVWIAIGAISAVIVLLLIVLIARGGGGTTIVKD